jgi:hypothetical protein
MIDFIVLLLQTMLATCRDVLPVFALIFIFQLGLLRQPIPHLKTVLTGICYVILGLTFFQVGLDMALFPLGEAMAQQLSSPSFLLGEGATAADLNWTNYIWVYLFAFCIGFATTVAEPSLLAVALKAQEVSGGTLKQRPLRTAVALGVAFGIALGTFRIVTGTPLSLYILVGYCIVVVQTFFAPKNIIPLAYDSGGVTTSTVTVPIVAALGLGLAGSVPGRNPALDGFGLIAFASLFPIIAVLGYAQIVSLLGRRRNKE